MSCCRLKEPSKEIDQTCREFWFFNSEVQKLFTTGRGQIKNIQVQERPNITLLGRESKQDNEKIIIVFFQNENIVVGF